MNTWHTRWVIDGLVIIVALMLIFPQSSYPAIYGPPATSRTYVSLTPSWKFHKGNVANAQVPGFNDQAWSSISLPHTWNNLDGQDGGNNYYRGVGWYRKHYVVPAAFAGRSLYLQFDGAATAAEVWINGVSAGRHRGGFAAFQMDITRLAKVGADNVIAVRVRNNYNADIPPLGGDFTVFGGLHRRAYLVATDKLQVRDLTYAGPGVYLATTNVSAGSASLQVRTKLWNGNSSAKNVTVKASVVDAAMNIITQASTVKATNAATGKEVVQNFTIVRPRLWNARKDPYLYKVFVELRADGRVADVVSQPLGFRSFYLDPDRGFFLNGQHLDLHGVNRHNDRIGKGWAISTSDQDEDFALIKEVGATAVRLAHYQHDQYFYDLCDRTGMVVWTEVPLINRITASTDFTNNARQQLTELIRQNYNHPSIMFWGLANEILAWPGPDPKPLISQLAQLARAEDATRLVTLADNKSVWDPISSYTDTVGYNKYFGWYGTASFNSFGPWADSAHQAFPLRPLAVSEYGAGASIYQHQVDPPKPDPGGKWHPEEYQNLFHEAHRKAMKQRNFLWGTFIWNMFDFAADARNEGDTPGRNDKGLVTYDRKVKKDAFFWYKANWSSDPFVYLTSRRFQPRTTLINKVKVYSNIDSVELLLNQVSLGTKSSTDRIFEWQNVSFRNGSNVLEARGVKDGEVYTDTITVMVDSGS